MNQMFFRNFWRCGNHARRAASQTILWRNMLVWTIFHRHFYAPTFHAWIFSWTKFDRDRHNIENRDAVLATTQEIFLQSCIKCFSFPGLLGNNNSFREAFKKIKNPKYFGRGRGGQPHFRFNFFFNHAKMQRNNYFWGLFNPPSMADTSEGQIALRFSQKRGPTTPKKQFFKNHSSFKEINYPPSSRDTF